MSEQISQVLDNSEVHLNDETQPKIGKENPIVQEVMELSQDLALADLRLIYAEIGRKIAAQTVPSDLMLLYGWQSRKPKDRVVQMQFLPTDSKKGRSCIAFVKELKGQQRHWLISDFQKKLSKKQHKNLVAMEVVKQMKAAGIVFKYQGALEEFTSDVPV